MSDNTISELTRRDVFDFIRANHIQWYGRLREEAFLDRLYDLDVLPSTDQRVSTARSDFGTHRVAFPEDWPDDWVLSDGRFGLESGPDEVLLAFLSEMVHPAVRPYDDETRRILDTFNTYLALDGWEIAERSQISGRPVFAARSLLAGSPVALDHAQVLANALDAGRVAQQVRRMKSGIDEDPELAIGTAKEFVETMCRTILDARGGTYAKDDDAPRLVKLTLKKLRLAADSAPADAAVTNIIQRLTGGLGSIAQGLAELRNLHGTGHGKSAWHEAAELRHARLAVGAASALGVFLYETHVACGEEPGADTPGPWDDE